MLRSVLRRELSPGRRPPGSGRAILAAALLTLVTAAPHAPAQFTWHNPAGGNWSVGANWQGGTAPTSAATTALVFGSAATQAAGYTSINDVTNPFLLNALTVNNTAGTVTLDGNPLNFTGTNPTITVMGAGSMLLSSAVNLSATTTVTGSGTGGLNFGGAVNGGANNLVKTSSGPLTLAAGGSLNTLSLRAGSTSVTGGTLALTSPSGAVDLNAGLQLGTASGQTAFFTASGGARISVTENVHIGDAAGSNGTVTITGAGTLLDTAPAGVLDRISVGRFGTGTLNITAGGRVNSVVDVLVGSGAGSTGHMVVDGVGSTATSVFIWVGNQGNGTLTVRNGGTVNVTGTSFPFIVGNLGVGTVTVRDSGTLTALRAYVGYGGDAGMTGTGTLTVTGAGSTMTVGTPTTNGFLGVGMTTLGTGTFNVQNGGLVTVNGNAHGAFFDGRGTFNVTDAGSLLRVTGQLTLGGTSTFDPGTADLNVGAGGTVTVTGRAMLQNASAINLNAGGTLSVGGLADGPRTVRGVVNLAAGTTLNLTDGGTTLSGVIGGAGNLAKAGAGIQTLAGANTYSGNTTVSAGTLLLTGNGSFAASPRITVGTAPGSTAVLDVAGVTGGANSVNGSFALASGQTLAGHGTVVGPVTVTNNSGIAPGASVGTLNVDGIIWQGGGRYDFEFSGAMGDLINGTAALDLGALNSSNRFTINIQSFDASLTTPQTYTLATFTGGISGFDATPGNPQFTFAGLFVPGSASVALQGNSLRLTFTPAPEPDRALLLGAATVCAVRWRRRRPRPGGRPVVWAALLAVLTTAPAAPAQSDWNNPAGGNWSVGGNWQGGTAPASGVTTALVFASPATQAASFTATNDIGNPFQLNALTVNNTTGTVTLAGSPLAFAGASPTITVGGAGSMALSADATLSATTTIAGTGSGGFTFGGAITGGTNNLVQSSTGVLTLAAGGSLNALQLTAGTTNVTGGTLALTQSSTAAESLLMGTAAGQTTTLNLTGGRINITEHARIGQAAGSTGIVSVSGAGTVLANSVAGTTGLIRVGANGGGSLSVTAGATVNALNLYLGLSAGSTGDMLIDGPGSTVNSSYMFRVGTGGNGTLTVRNGGTLNAGTVSANFAFIVGNIGVGNLTIRDGGRINSPAFFIGYGGTGDVPGIGTTTVTGPGSVLTVSTPTAGGFLGVSMTTAGVGTLNVQNGGQALVNGDTLGAVFAGQGTINVTDPGSLLQTRGIALGGDFTVPGGTATLNVGAAGTVTVAARAALHTGGTINLNAGGVMSVGTLVDGRFNSTGVVNLAAGTNLTITDGGTTFSGPIRGAGGLAMTGAGVQTLAGANTYTGNTVISSGTVRLLSTGLLASQRIIVGTAPASSAVLDVSAFSSFSLGANQTLAGHGTVAGTVTVAGGAAVAPGTSVGTLNVADMAWLGGGRYDFEFAGTTGDLLNGTGSLNLGSLNGTNRFTINIQSFDASLTTPQTYTLATFAGGIAGFDATPGNPQFTFAGLFVPGSASMSLQGNSLRLTFTPVAESAHLLLLCALAAIARFSSRTSVSPARPGSRAER